MLAGRKPPPRVSVIVPARDEEANIADCVRSLLAAGPEVEILVADDGSEDATAEIVRRLAAAFLQVKLIAVPAVPEGWLGKPHALAVGAEQARGRWILFTDADTRHAPGRLGEVIDRAESEGFEMVSFSPSQQTQRWWEKAVIPQIYRVLARLYPYKRVNDPADPLAAANGQYILIRRDVYVALGGHAAIRNAVLDDVELARRAKHAGYRIRFGSGEGIVLTRMYRRFAAMWEGWTKNLFLLYDRNYPAIGRAMAERAFRYLLPAIASLLLLTARSGGAMVAGVALLVYLVVEHYCYGRALPADQRVIETLLLVPGTVLFLLLLGNSTRRYWGRKTITWKGRRYRAAV